jgi:hypothetical protein
MKGTTRETLPRKKASGAVFQPFAAVLFGYVTRGSLGHKTLSFCLSPGCCPFTFCPLRFSSKFGCYRGSLVYQFIVAPAARMSSRRSCRLEEEEEKKQEHACVGKNQGTNGKRALKGGTGRQVSSPLEGTNPNPLVPTAGRHFAAATGTVLRLLLLEVPLVLVFSCAVSLWAIERFGHDYVVPQIELLKWDKNRAPSELTYYHRVCDASDQTAFDTSDLIVTPEMSTDEAVDLMIQHGASVYPDLLSVDTATKLRDFILRQNAKNQDMIGVIANKHRWSFYLRVDQDPTVTAALKEVLNKPVLVDAIQAIAGRNPAVIEFTAITAAYGAKSQHWHQDVVPEGNGAKYGRTFVQSYSLFIPLQNTTAGMGATGICPGTHMCAEGAGKLCGDSGFQLSGEADNWPVGWGALLNQQTTHRGSAYSDPPDGPHRAVFIITFSTRPRFAEKQVETRIIGTGGSYSLHWSHWGHTLTDFQDPARYMKPPWRALRSLGLYKPATSDWGWDFVTQASARISNSEVGYTKDDLEGFVEKGGFWFLPNILQGEVRPEDEDTPAWIHFVFDTISRCRTAANIVYLGFLSLYIIGSILLTVNLHRGKAMGPLASSLLRILILHSFVLLLAWWGQSNMRKRTWARKVRASQQFRLPSGLHASIQDIPASLALREDILMLQDMKSDYLASFAHVLEVVHPGNRKWHRRIESNSFGYNALSPSLKQMLRTSILASTQQEQQRIMTKNRSGNWAEVDQMTADWFCHEELSSGSNAHVKVAMRAIDNLMSETQFGYWRETELHRKHIPELLMHLQDALLHLSRRRRGAKNTTGARENALSSTMKIASSLMAKPTSCRHKMGSRSSLPPRQQLEKPYPEGWCKEGDTVEANYDSRFEGKWRKLFLVGQDASVAHWTLVIFLLPIEWYRASITGASSDDNTWNVIYEDGEESFELCQYCVRAFVPYLLDEHVEVRTDKSAFSPGKVVFADSSTESYTVLLDDGEVVEGAPVPRCQLFSMTIGTSVSL